MRTRYTNQRDTGEAELALSQMQAIVYDMHEKIYSMKMQMAVDLLRKFYRGECFVYFNGYRNFTRIGVRDDMIYTQRCNSFGIPEDSECIGSEYELDEIIDNLKNGDVYRNERNKRDRFHTPLYAPLRIPDNPTLGVEEVQLR